MENIFYEDEIFYFDELTKEIFSYESEEPVRGILYNKVLQLGKRQSDVFSKINKIFKLYENAESVEEKIQFCDLIFDYLLNIKQIFTISFLFKKTVQNKLRELGDSGYERTPYYLEKLFR